MEELSQASLDRLKTISGIGDEIASSIVQFFQQKDNQKVIQKLKRIGGGISISASSSATNSPQAGGENFCLYRFAEIFKP